MHEGHRASSWCRGRCRRCDQSCDLVICIAIQLLLTSNQRLHFTHIPHQVADVVAAVQHVHHLVGRLARRSSARLSPGSRSISASHSSSSVCNSSQQRFVLLFELRASVCRFRRSGGIVFAHLFVHAQFFELHVQLEDFFQQIGRDDLLLDLSGGAGLFGRALRLLFQFARLPVQQIFRALDRIFQRAVGVVEQRALLEAPFLLLAAGAGVQIGMQLAAEFVKISFPGPRRRGSAWAAGRRT